MRVVLIGPIYPYRGGIAHYTTMLCRTLRDRGHRVLMVSFKRQYPQWLFPGRSDRDPSQRPLGAGNAQYWIDPLNPFTWLTTFSRIASFDPDRIVLQWWTTFWAPVWCVLGLLNRVFLGCPLIYLCHNVLPHERHVWDSTLTRLALHWGTHFVVQSSEEKRRLQAVTSIAAIDIVPHPVYDMFAGEAMGKEEARAQLELPYDVPVLLFFGIVREYKGLRDLLAALPRIHSRLGEATLVVAGEFWEDKADYEKTIHQLGVTELVRLEDRYIPNEQVPVFFSAADVLIAPYRQATGSGTVQLALGCGCPVITTPVGDLDQVIEEGITGIITKPADSEALAEDVIRFFEDSQGCLRRYPGPAGRTAPGWQQLAAAIEEPD